MNGLSLPSFLDERLHSRKPAFFENFFETLLIIAFCSFAIGLYWRFKFRSCYWAAELEETRLLNMQLKKMQLPPITANTNDIVLKGNTNETLY